MSLSSLDLVAPSSKLQHWAETLPYLLQHMSSLEMTFFSAFKTCPNLLRFMTLLSKHATSNCQNGNVYEYHNGVHLD